MFIELNKPKVIDIYRTGSLGYKEILKIRLDETGKLTPLTLSLTFDKVEEIEQLIEQIKSKLKSTTKIET